METIKTIVTEICRFGCEQCACKSDPKGCERILDDYVKRIKEAADFDGDDEN